MKRSSHATAAGIVLLFFSFRQEKRNQAHYIRKAYAAVARLLLFKFKFLVNFINKKKYAYLYAVLEGRNFTMVVVNLHVIASSCHNCMIYIHPAMSLVIVGYFGCQKNPRGDFPLAPKKLPPPPLASRFDSPPPP